MNLSSDTYDLNYKTIKILQRLYHYLNIRGAFLDENPFEYLKQVEFNSKYIDDGLLKRVFERMFKLYSDNDKCIAMEYWVNLMNDDKDFCLQTKYLYEGKESPLIVLITTEPDIMDRYDFQDLIDKYKKKYSEHIVSPILNTISKTFRSYLSESDEAKRNEYLANTYKFCDKLRLALTYSTNPYHDFHTRYYSYKIGNKVAPYDLGLEFFDNIKPYSFNCICAKTACGKSTLAVSLFCYALLRNLRVAYLTIEMPEEDVADLSFSILTETFVDDQVEHFEGQLEEFWSEEERKIFDRHHLIHKVRTADDVIAFISREEYDMVFIDHLGIMQSKGGYDGFNDDLNNIVAAGIDHHTTIIGLAQLSNEATELPLESISTKHIARSIQIPQLAYKCIALDRGPELSETLSVMRAKCIKDRTPGVKNSYGKFCDYYLDKNFNKVNGGK